VTEPTKRDSATLRPIESELESRATTQVRASDIAKLAELDPERGPFGEALRDPFVILILLALLIGSAIFFVPRVMWRMMPAPADRVLLVNYTVPYVSGREHRGAVWLLNHAKYRAPDGRTWDSVGTHVGYNPLQRTAQTTIAQQDLSKVDWLFISDAYGVYEDDLIDIENELAHLDRSTKIFGGLSDADAAALIGHSERGGHTFLEFNALEDPTGPAARDTLESLFGIEWTGWVGRTFSMLQDTTDVPHWLPRLFAQHYGDRPLPIGPTLVLVHTDGRLLLVEGRTLASAGPHVSLTNAGKQVLRGASGGADYPFWFPIYTVNEGTELLAELILPENPKIKEILRREGLTGGVPLLTRRITETGAHQIYLMADMSDTEFTPGRWDLAGPKWLQAISDFQPDLDVGHNAFWDFYVPAVSSLLKSPR
jgi:hypothetical protein